MGVNLKGSTTPTPGAPGGILQAIRDGITGIGDALAEGISGLISGLIDMVTGNYTGDMPAFIDGQLALNERFELLAEVAGYGNAYMTKNYWMGSAGGGAIGQRGREVPFRDYLGPHKNCELAIGTDGTVETGHWVLLAPGTWRADLTATIGNGVMYAEWILEVCKPDGTVWHRKVAHMDVPDTSNVTYTMHTTFVAPDAGYTVTARKTKPTGTLKALVVGGTERSSFSVNRWDIDTTDHADAPTVPDGPDIG